MESKPPKLAEVRELYAERENLLQWINPKPDPAQWPPMGWQVHPDNPELLFRVVSAEDLREEIFGSERKTEWLKQAQARVDEIEAILTKYFFPKAKEEGTERKEKNGFAVMLKTGLKRVFDVAALAPVVESCQKIAAKKKLSVDVEAAVVQWVPKLKLKEFRELPDPIREELENALVITPEKPVFEIVKVED